MDGSSPHRYSLRRMIPEQPVTIPFAPGLSLEGALTLPDRCPAGVVLCHPHPRYGGDMDSPVVVAAAEACAGQGLATLRFNFRGVGDSGGAWDEGRGEQDDVRAALALLRQRLQPTARLALAGYSFGASMSSRVAAGDQHLAGLALIAPPLISPGWQPSTETPDRRPRPSDRRSRGPVLPPGRPDRPQPDPSSRHPHDPRRHRPLLLHRATTAHHRPLRLGQQSESQRRASSAPTCDCNAREAPQLRRVWAPYVALTALAKRHGFAGARSVGGMGGHFRGPPSI